MVGIFPVGDGFDARLGSDAGHRLVVQFAAGGDGEHLCGLQQPLVQASLHNDLPLAVGNSQAAEVGGVLADGGTFAESRKVGQHLFAVLPTGDEGEMFHQWSLFFGSRVDIVGEHQRMQCLQGLWFGMGDDQCYPASVVPACQVGQQMGDGPVGVREEVYHVIFVLYLRENGGKLLFQAAGFYVGEHESLRSKVEGLKSKV